MRTECMVLHWVLTIAAVMIWKSSSKKYVRKMSATRNCSASTRQLARSKSSLLTQQP
jgi:hypothetical protein